MHVLKLTGNNETIMSINSFYMVYISIPCVMYCKREIDFSNSLWQSIAFRCRISRRYNRCLRKLAVCRICIIVCKSLLIPLPGIAGIHFARHTDCHPIKFSAMYQSRRSAAPLSRLRLYIFCGTIPAFVLARSVSSAG